MVLHLIKNSASGLDSHFRYFSHHEFMDSHKINNGYMGVYVDTILPNEYKIVK